MTVLDVLHFLAGTVVLAEALNKLERIDLSVTHSAQQKIIGVTKTAAWSLLALGGAAAVIGPLAPSLVSRPSWQDVCVIFGCAVLVIRTRIKESTQ